MNYSLIFHSFVVVMHLKYLLLIFLMPLNNGLVAQSLNFEEVKLEQNADNVLRVQALVHTSEPAHVFVQYDYAEGWDSFTETSAISPLQKEHNLTLVALRDSTSYKFRVFAFNKQNLVQSQVYELTTPGLPLAIQNFDPPRINLLENRQTYTLNNTVRGNERFFFICDTEGKLVWYAEYPALHNVCNGWRWTKENTILQADCQKIMEVDLLGNVLTEIDINEPSWNLHHDVMRLRDGNIIAIYTKPEIADLTQSIGDANATVAVDGYIIINPEGEIIDNWSASDHFNIQTARRMGGYWNFIYGTGTVDWCHFNALEEDIDGSILISVSHWSRILKIDRPSGEVKWQLGEGGTLRVPPDFVIKQQHAITILAPNRYLIFDNLGLQESSRVIEFAVETNDNEAFKFWEYVPEPSIVSLTRGNAQRLSNKNTLIFFPTSSGVLQEVDADGTLLWEVNTLNSGYRAYRIPYMNEPHAEVYFTELPDSICSNAEPFEIKTQPINAYLSGEAIENGIFYPGKAGNGANKVFASYGTSLKEIEINVMDIPQPNIQVTDNQFLKIEDAFESYQWYLNDTLIDGATRHQYEAAASGLYHVAISNLMGCIAYSDTLNYLFVNITDNIDEELELIQLEDHLIVKHPPIQKLSVEIFNLQGQKIDEHYGNNHYQINTTHLPLIYVVRIFNGQQIRVEKILNL